MVELKEKSEELKRKTRLLGERNQQVHTLERDLAVKEETIQKLRVQLEEVQLSADQVDINKLKRCIPSSLCVVDRLRINVLVIAFKRAVHDQIVTA